MRLYDPKPTCTSDKPGGAPLFAGQPFFPRPTSSPARRLVTGGAGLLKGELYGRYGRDGR